MKYIIPLLLIFISCGPESKMFEKTYSIKNSSKQQVRLNFYLANDNLVLTEVLENNQKYVGLVVETTNEESFENPESSAPSSSYSGSISVEIIYNNSFITTMAIVDQGNNGSENFTLPINRNVFRNGNYIDVGNNILEYVIRQEDFKNATPCDGPCE